MNSPDENKYDEIDKYIRSCHIMTLGTSDIKKVWTSPVFYLYSGSAFYFFSKKTSRHIQFAKKTGIASASIHHNPEEWADIKGIQMEGSISEASHDKKSVEAFKTYMKRFSFIQEIIKNPFSGSLVNFQEQFKVRWYTFIPEKMIYVDNSVHFGFKLELKCREDVDT